MKHNCCNDRMQKIPENYEFCCRTFFDHTLVCVFDIRYEYGKDTWGIVISDLAGGGYIPIDFCPHCGKKL
jgi:hypothetical protein